MTDKLAREAFKARFPHLEAELALGEKNEAAHGLDDMAARHAYAKFAAGWEAARAALAEHDATPHAAPVAWRYRYWSGGKWFLADEPMDRNSLARAGAGDSFEEQPLYASPQPAAQPVDERKAFEAWCASDLVWRGDKGAAWMGWQARAAVAAQPVALTDEQIEAAIKAAGINIGLDEGTPGYRFIMMDAFRAVIAAAIAAGSKTP